MDTIILTPNIMALPNSESQVSIKHVSAIEKKPKKKKKERCAFPGCNKKLGITSFPCKCEKKFCSLHLMPELHACTFDYKKQGQELIRKKNPVIINSKVTMI